ncbi:cytochrome c [Sansalvadorimonas sp. 2012CJ34-2]|uniref:Cytochrome c n=1 Tax=Parendozoicomonas callyspongiae TaxID=2942213 RepID=A0ABT0PBN0_9GAMM|nr:c-type cytochrome [Sansalvadorimonas sp. 2012CJ34-2]MCL6268788.1 cytochrome c [Sansalvadorimonas sp. 2012CJ34-2]
MKLFSKIFLTVLASHFLLTPALSAPDTQVCEQCHGKNGVSHNPDAPTLAGLPAINIEDALYAFANGLRPESQSPDNQDAGHKLSQDSAVLLASYFAKQKFIPTQQTFNPSKVSLGKRIFDLKCESCHTDAGSMADDETSLLAGQHTPYLRKQINHFISGARKNSSGTRKDTLDGLKEKHINALLDYLASHQ